MQERKERKITLKQVFDEYPSCFFLVEPIIKDGKSEDFKSIAFSLEQPEKKKTKTEASTRKIFFIRRTPKEILRMLLLQDI